MLGTDVRLAWRALCRARGFAATAVIIAGLTFGLIGAVTTLIHGILVQPLAFAEADDLVALGRTRPSARALFGASLPDYLDWREQSHAWLQDLGAYSLETVRLQRGQEPMAARAALVTTNLWSMLGVRAVQGRSFTADDAHPSSPRVVMIAESLWRSQFGGAREVLGRPLRIDGLAPETNGLFIVIGIVPNSAALGYDHTPVVFFPLSTAGIDRHGSLRRVLSNHVVGRLKPGIGYTQAAEALASIRPAEYGAHTTADRISTRRLKDVWLDGSRDQLRLFAWIVGFVALVAVTNLAGLFLAHAHRRRPQFAIQLSLGARRLAVFRQLFTEAALLAATGAGIGLLLAGPIVALFEAFIPVALPRMREVKVSVNVAVVLAGCSLLTAVILSAIPARLLTRSDGQASQGRQREGNAHWVRWIFASAQLVLATCLLTGAGNLVGRLTDLTRVQLGFDPSQTTMIRVDHTIRGGEDPASDQRSYQSVLANLAGMPGVRAVSLMFPAPFEHSYRSSVSVGETTFEEVSWVRIGTGYFATLGVRVLAGRDLTSAEAFGGSSVLVNKRFADLAFGENAVGQPLQFGQQTMTVVGVVADARQDSLVSPMEPILYVPFKEAAVPPVAWIAIRESEPGPVRAMLRRHVASSIPTAVVGYPVSLDAWVGGFRAPTRFLATLVGTFSVAALVLGGCGIYSVMCFIARGRRREIAIRIAVGATPASIIRLLLREAGAVTAVAMVIGMLLSTALVWVFGAVIVDVRPTWSVAAAVAAALAFVSMAASAQPVIRAARSDPAVELRSE